MGQMKIIWIVMKLLISDWQMDFTDFDIYLIFEH